MEKWKLHSIFEIATIARKSRNITTGARVVQRKPPNSIRPNLEAKTTFCYKITANQVSGKLNKLGFENFETKKMFQEKI